MNEVAIRELGALGTSYTELFNVGHSSRYLPGYVVSVQKCFKNCEDIMKFVERELV